MICGFKENQKLKHLHATPHAVSHLGSLFRMENSFSVGLQLLNAFKNVLIGPVVKLFLGQRFDDLWIPAPREIESKDQH